MPLSFSEVQKNEATVTIPAYGETLTIVYYPTQVTDEVFITFAGFDGITTVKGAKDALVDLNGLLCTLIKSWDFFEDKEQTVMVPLDPTRMAKLELPFKMKCLFAIMRHVRPEADLPQIPT
jgi:hypothetical protein